jgi:hypothetical protein
VSPVGEPAVASPNTPSYRLRLWTKPRFPPNWQYYQWSYLSRMLSEILKQGI